ncbi:MAG: PIN domain protein [Dehalococcoidia bacterium]
MQFTRRKLRFYLETSVFGSLFDFEDPARIEVTGRLIDEAKNGAFEAYISPLVMAEIDRAPADIKQELLRAVGDLRLPALAETEETIRLAQDYIQEGVVPQRFRDDARHIAIPVVYELDALISWNYKHMVNLRARRMVNALNLRLGYRSIEILSPQEVISYGEVDS